MLDLEALKDKLATAEGRGLIGVTPAALRQIIAEIEAGRDAAARAGCIFAHRGARTL